MDAAITTVKENLEPTMVHLRASPFEELWDQTAWFKFERTNVMQVEEGEWALHKHAYLLDDSIQTHKVLLSLCTDLFSRIYSTPVNPNATIPIYRYIFILCTADVLTSILVISYY